MAGHLLGWDSHNYCLFISPTLLNEILIFLSCRSCSISPQSFLKRNYSVCRYIFGVSMGGSEISLFLYNYLEPFYPGTCRFSDWYCRGLQDLHLHCATFMLIQYFNITHKWSDPQSSKILTSFLPTHKWQSSRLKDMVGFPLIITKESINKDTGCMQGMCHGEMRVDERGKAQCGIPSYNSFQWQSRLDIKEQTLRTPFFPPHHSQDPVSWKKWENCNGKKCSRTRISWF